MTTIVYNKRKKNPELVKYKFIESGEFKATFTTDNPEKYLDEMFNYGYLKYAAIGVKREDITYEKF
jgi:hypothetical protein